MANGAVLVRLEVEDAELLHYEAAAVIARVRIDVQRRRPPFGQSWCRVTLVPEQGPWVRYAYWP